MKSMGIRIAAVAVLSTASVMPAWARDKQAEAAIRSIEQAIVDARSVEPVVQYFDPQIVMYDFMPPTIRGISAFIGHVEAVFAAIGFSASVQAPEGDLVQ